MRPNRSQIEAGLPPFGNRLRSIVRGPFDVVDDEPLHGRSFGGQLHAQLITQRLDEGWTEVFFRVAIRDRARESHSVVEMALEPRFINHIATEFAVEVTISA